MPRLTYTGGFAAVNVVHPDTGALLGEVERGGDIDVPDAVVDRLSAEFIPTAAPVDTPKKKEAVA